MISKTIARYLMAAGLAAFAAWSGWMYHRGYRAGSAGASAVIVKKGAKDVAKAEKAAAAVRATPADCVRDAYCRRD